MVYVYTQPKPPDLNLKPDDKFRVKNNTKLNGQEGTVKNYLQHCPQTGRAAYEVYIDGKEYILMSDEMEVI